MARLFVAVRPSASVLAQIEALPRPTEPGVRWVPSGQWHITLRFIGEAEPAPVADALRQALSLPAADEAVQAVRVVLGPKVSRLGRSVVCLPASGLDALAASASRATASFGQPPDPRPFAGHVTLARLARRAACGLAGAPFDASFEAREVELVQSALSSQGARHEVVETFPLV